MDEYTCGSCSERFSEIITFLLHKVNHVDGGRNSSCLLCGLSFSRQISLQEHLYHKHNIPGLQTQSGEGPTNGKRRGRPPKKSTSDMNGIVGRSSKTFNGEVLEENVGSKTESCDARDTSHIKGVQNGTRESNGNQLCSESHDGPLSASSLETTHIVIDRISDDNIVTNTFPTLPAQANDAVVLNQQDASHCMKPASPNHTADGSQGGEKFPADILQESHVSSHCETESSHSVHAVGQETELLSNVDDVVPETVPTVSVKSENHCVVTTIINTPSLAHISEAAIPVMSASSFQHKTGEHTDVDFLFVLLSRSVRGNTFNYSKLSFSCFHCDYKTTWRNCLVRHMQEKHPDMLAIHQCISIQNPETADQQRIMKMSEFTSLHAHQRKLAKTKRIRSVETQDLPGTFVCSKCDKTFGRLRYLRQHLKTHRSDKKHLCDECGKAFKTKSYLTAHRQTHKLKSYSCSQCNFTSTVNSLIHAHRQLHSEGCVLCDVCGSAYNDRTTLKKHKQVHDPSRPHPCTYPGCTWRFLNEVMCRAHFRAHTTPGRFTCTVCGYVFRHKHHLQRHLVKIHSMDKATVYRITASRQHNQMHDHTAVETSEGRVEVMHEQEQPIQETVNLIMNSDISSEQLQTMLEIGQLVIATDGSDNTINYEVADITMGVDCHTLIENEDTSVSGQTILIPHTAECSQIILHQEPEPVPADVET